MFSLILTIIAIAIATALGLATIYYGGSAFSQGKESAQVARVINDAAQIQGAITLYAARFGVAPHGTQSEIKDALLASNSLASFPESADWVFVDDNVTVQNISDAQCLAFNKKLDVSSIPQCSDVASLSRSLCCKG